MVIQQQALWSAAAQSTASPTVANEQQSNNELQLQQHLVNSQSPGLCNERIFIKTEPTEFTPRSSEDHETSTADQLQQSM